MASTKEFARYICDLIDDAGTVRCRKMFGEYGIYCNDVYWWKCMHSPSGRLFSVTEEYGESTEIHPFFSAIPLHPEIFRSALQ